jgi:hypothetical protein
MSRKVLTDEKRKIINKRRLAKKGRKERKCGKETEAIRKDRRTVRATVL